jgi:hypothetical protein
MSDNGRFTVVAVVDVKIFWKDLSSVERGKEIFGRVNEILK